MAREYILHSLDTTTYRTLTLENTESRELVSAPNADDLGSKLAKHEPAAPKIRLDRHCEEYLSPGVVNQILRAYNRVEAKVK